MMESELLNKRFDEHRRRQGLQGLPCLSVEDDVGDDDTVGKHEGHHPTTAYTSEDKSRKGSVDAKILPLVTLINSTNDLFTTSTCSGRIILFTNESVVVDTPAPSHPTITKIKKRGCQWLMVSHEEVSDNEFLEAWRKACTAEEVELSFKMEPAILHVQCRKLSDAKKLIHAATESGFRNSGMVVGRDNRITVAVRSTIGFEVPLSTVKCPDGSSLITDTYLTYLIQKANEKMKENWRRMNKVTEEFRKAFNS